MLHMETDSLLFAFVFFSILLLLLMKLSMFP